MAINTQTIRIDLNPGRSIPVAYSHQGDTARSFVFEVYNNGEAFPLTGYTAKIAAMLPADNGYRVIAGDNMADGAISGNTITATLPADFTAKPGRGVLTIVLTGSGATIRPINVDLRIQKSADAPETIAGASDFAPVLERYMAEDMQTYINAWLDAHPEAMQYYISGSKLVLDENGILSIQNDTDEIVEALDLDTLRADVTDLKSDLYYLTASTVAEMTDTGAIYKYTGNESGYTTNALYFYNGTAWEKIASGNVEVGTDTTMSVSGTAADAKAVGDYFGTELVEAHNVINSVTYGNGWFNAAGTIRNDNGYRYTVDYLPISILRMAKSVEFHTQYISCCVYYDSEKSVVGAEVAGAGSNNILQSVTIPDGAVYFRVSQDKSYIDPFPVKLPTLADVAIQPSASTSIPASGIIETPDQGGLSASGATIGYTHWKVSDYINVVPNTVLEYGGCGNIGGNATLVPIAFYDAEKNFISCVLPDKSDYVHIYRAGWESAPTSGTSMNAGLVVVPSNAVYCRVSGYLSIKPYLNYAHENNWMGKKCVFFGDSITAGIGTVSRYSDFLALFKGIIVENYAVNGSVLVTNGMERVQTFASDYTDADDPDAFFFAYGTNDFTGQKPIGEWYEVAADGTRTLTTDSTTFKGVLANIVTYIKTNYDGAKIIFMTPLRRGEGSYVSDLKPSNGKYLSDFADAIKEAKDVLGVEVIDLYGDSGLNPNINPSTKFFTPNDRLHPNVEGHLQIAKVISAKLNAISP